MLIHLPYHFSLTDRDVDRRVAWLANTFRDSEEAEEALAADRQRFLQQRAILRLLPRDIRKHVNHNGDNGQIKGFEELFVYLERSSAAGELRARMIAYFKGCPVLRAHLSRSFILKRGLFSTTDFANFLDNGKDDLV